MIRWVTAAYVARSGQEVRVRPLASARPYREEVDGPVGGPAAARLTLRDGLPTSRPPPRTRSPPRFPCRPSASRNRTPTDAAEPRLAEPPITGRPGRGRDGRHHPGALAQPAGPPAARRDRCARSASAASRSSGSVRHRPGSRAWPRPRCCCRSRRVARDLGAPHLPDVVADVIMYAVDRAVLPRAWP